MRVVIGRSGRTYGCRIGVYESKAHSHDSGQAHSTCECALGGISGREALHEEHRAGDGGAPERAVEPVCWSGIANHALEVTASGELEVWHRGQGQLRSDERLDGFGLGLRVAVNEL